MFNLEYILAHTNYYTESFQVLLIILSIITESMC